MFHHHPCFLFLNIYQYLILWCQFCCKMRGTTKNLELYIMWLGEVGEFSFGPKALGVDLKDLQLEILIMDEPQKKLNQRHEGRPRKVRFKISSACSGRVLKQVFEDGQELELPAKERSRRFIRHSFEPVDNFCGTVEKPENRLYPPAKLTAQRISIFREDDKYGLTSNSPLLSDHQPGESHCRASPIIDFGKIIIYTNNLKIIRAPIDQKELMRRIVHTEGINDWTFIHRERRERFGGGHKIVMDVEKKAACNQYVLEGDAGHGCSQCKGSGSAPCSQCHGSKFSMLANRFKESYRALRCPACNESGLQPCRICAA